MALYSNSAFGPPFKNIKRLSTQIEPNYFFGARDYKTDNMIFDITQVSLTSNVATLTVQLISGGGPSIVNGLPVVGAKMGVRGTQSNSGVFNVDPTTLTGTTVAASTGAGTLTYALTNGNVSATADVGQVVVQSAEVPDLVSNGSASAPYALVFTPDESDNSRCLFAEAKWFGTMPTTATVSLQVANVDDAARYQSLPTPIAVVTGSAVVQSGSEFSFVAGKFLRCSVAMTGGDGTTALVVTVFA